MNTKKIAILGVAAFSAVGAALLFSMVMNSAAPERIVEVQSAPVVEILVAADNLKPGDALSADRVTWREWPEAGLTDHVITRSAEPDAVSRYAGSVVRGEIFAGEPIHAGKLISSGEGSGYLSLLLAGGKRAYSIQVAANTSVAGFILPGDHVDVLLSTNVGNRGNVGREGIISSTLMENIRVLAVDQKTDIPTGAHLGKTVTLEVTPRQAEQLAAALLQGSISLGLRSALDSGPNSASRTPEDSGVGYVVYRGGVRSVMLSVR